MGTQQTVDVLKAYAALLSDCGDPSGADAVRGLASALSVATDTTVKATVAKVQKVWARSPDMVASPRGLGNRLNALQGLLADAGAKVASTDVMLLAELLDGKEAVEPRAFENALRRAILAPPAEKRASVKSKREPLSAAEIRQWAGRLTATTTDQAAFEAELSAVLAIPKLSVPELFCIAQHYLGYEPPKGRSSILKKLRTRQMQDAIEAGRQSRIQRIAV